MKTQIFKSYEDFLNRADKSLNGVSEDFAAAHPDFEKDNETNAVGIVKVIVKNAQL